MPFIYNDRKYNSKKHPILEYIFNQKNPNKDTSILNIPFTLSDISAAYSACGIEKPASISNTILDLTRKKRPISSRLPQSIYSLGYDLRKKTGKLEDGGSFAGEFVFVGVGNEIESWLSWPEQFEENDTIIISSEGLPKQILPFIRNDEGALFSVIDYCDILSKVFGLTGNSILRIQHPLKWQPNEIDGFYIRQTKSQTILFPVEAKALTTGDDINLEQMKGAMKVMCERFNKPSLHIMIQPLAAKMVTNGINLAIFNPIPTESNDPQLICLRKILIKFHPEINSWT